MLNFNFYHVEIGKAENTKDVIVKGEIANNSDKSYSTVAVRVVLFKQGVTVANMIFTINGLAAGATRPFEKTFEDLDYWQVGKNIDRYDIYTETAF